MGLVHVTKEDMKRKKKLRCNVCGWEWYVDAFSAICGGCGSNDTKSLGFLNKINDQWRRDH